MEAMKVDTLVVGALQTNCYLAYCEKTRACAVVDPGADPGRIFRRVEDLGLKPEILIDTHGHVDHIGANRDVRDRFKIPICLHRADLELMQNALQSEIARMLGARPSPPPDRLLEEGDVLPIGAGELRVLHLPGHSPGGIGLLGDGFLMSGDTLFCGGVGRTDLPGGSWDELDDSIRRKIFTLPDDTVVYPGHMEETTVGREKESNPYVR
jgi:glyoxylase-like metal-dependent hydrolase (beta-lactamase superfamily II)